VSSKPPPTRPRRIVALCAEAADWLYRLGAWDRVVGVSAYYQSPPGAARKPRVSGFSKANVPQIARLHPDLVITFSDVQADLSAQLLRLGFPVLATNQRTLAEIEATLALIARAAGEEKKGAQLLKKFQSELAPVTVRRRKLVYFEEWNQPLISGIAWVGELIERAGGRDAFEEFRDRRRAPDRVVDPAEVIRRDPDIIVASWCGKPADLRGIGRRPGWSEISAVRKARVHEIPARYILQPGYPLVAGYRELKKIIAAA
jgi:iron complex transport system substrate-binding protein